MIGPGAEGDIAVDDLNIADGSCPQVITRGKESRYKVVKFGVMLCSMFSGWNLYYPIQFLRRRMCVLALQVSLFAIRVLSIGGLAIMQGMPRYFKWANYCITM